MNAPEEQLIEIENPVWLPPDGKEVYYYPDPHRGAGKADRVCRIRARSGRVWYAARPAPRNRIDTLIFVMPDRRTLFLDGFLVDSEDPMHWSMPPLSEVAEFRVSPDGKYAVVRDDCAVAGYDRNGLAWLTRLDHLGYLRFSTIDNRHVFLDAKVQEDIVAPRPEAIWLSSGEVVEAKERPESKPSAAPVSVVPQVPRRPPPAASPGGRAAAPFRPCCRDMSMALSFPAGRHILIENGEARLMVARTALQGGGEATLERALNFCPFCGRPVRGPRLGLLARLFGGAHSPAPPTDRATEAPRPGVAEESAIVNAPKSSLTFHKLNDGWNADPNAPEPSITPLGRDLLLRFDLNSLQFRTFARGEHGTLRFVDCDRYRLGATNDEGWYRGQCRYSHTAPRWGEFYEISGEDPSRDKPTDWIRLGSASVGRRHFLFYFRDNTFECFANGWRIEPEVGNALARLR